MTAENKCSECSLCNEIRKGESFRHRYGMIAVNFGPTFLQRNCTTKDESSLNLDEICDRPDEFVAKKAKVS